jgi:hypothetical protein
MVVQEMVAQAPGRVDKFVLYGKGATGMLPGRFETIDTSSNARQNDPWATARCDVSLVRQGELVEHPKQDAGHLGRP